MIHLHFPEVADLKGKRREVSSLKAQLHGRLGAAVSEVAHQDSWQRATLAAALTAGSSSELERRCDRVERWVDSRHPETSRIERHVLSTDDLGGL